MIIICYSCFFAVENQMLSITAVHLCQQANRQSCCHHEDEAQEEPDVEPLPTGEVIHGETLPCVVVEICTVVVRHDIPRNGGGNDNEQDD